MHNRISLLEAEERKALKRVEETRRKVESISKMRIEHLQMKLKARKADLERSKSKTKQRKEVLEG